AAVTEIMPPSWEVCILLLQGGLIHHLPIVPDIECDVRAGKINLPEFIVKCPAHCKETKQKVYGTDVFASISSICNAAIHRLPVE
uniref:LCCL domain-containing protein n=1 Tax=Monopterus albus TaxID=43700 RepID=A0A3Q3IQJ8_MONAL